MHYAITLTLPPDAQPSIQGIRDDDLGLSIVFSIEKYEGDTLGVIYDICIMVTPGDRYDIGSYCLGKQFHFLKWSQSEMYTDMYFLRVKRHYLTDTMELPLSIGLRKIMSAILLPNASFPSVALQKKEEKIASDIKQENNNSSQ